MFVDDGIFIRRKTGKIMIFFYLLFLTCLLFSGHQMSGYNISLSIGGNI